MNIEERNRANKHMCAPAIWRVLYMLDWVAHATKCYEQKQPEQREREREWQIEGGQGNVRQSAHFIQAEKEQENLNLWNERIESIIEISIFEFI